MMLAMVFALDVVASDISATWKTEHDAISCRAARNSTSASDGVQAILLSRDVLSPEVHVEVSATFDPAWRGKGGATWAASNDSTANTKVQFQSRTTPENRQSISINLPARYLSTYTVGQISIVKDDGKSKLELPSMAEGLSQLRACRHNQLNQLAVDISEVDDTMANAEGSTTPWITANDLPIRRATPVDYKGYMIWRVGTNGSLSNCSFAQTTGNSQLDGYLCNLLISRGRYLKPATKADGTPVPKWYGRWMALHF